jgi:hypothetical protein
MPEIWLSAGIEYYSLMQTHVSRSQSGRRERPENDAELQSSKAEAVQRQAPEVTRRQSLVQAKLSVGPADDVYEREADAVADRVVRSLAAPSMMAAAAGSGERVRRSAMPVSNITKIAPGAGRVRRFATVGVDGGELDADTDAAISASRGGGKAMGQDVRRKMEGAFGADFGGIRIHEGSKASELNNRIQAKAFTVGNDIYFRDGAPDASSRDGQHLLAHELTHTVQQGGRVQRSTDQIQRHTDIVQRNFMDSLKGLFGGKKKEEEAPTGAPTPPGLFQKVEEEVEKMVGQGPVADMRKGKDKDLQYANLPLFKDVTDNQRAVQLMLRSNTYTQKLLEFTRLQFNDENIDFLIAVRAYKKKPNATMAQMILSTYVVDKSKRQVNVSDPQRENTVTEAKRYLNNPRYNPKN